MVLTPRQIEILTILALCPQGMTLDTLHQALYGERKVSVGTLKAEMSQLRDLLGGMLGSRPYRILAHIEVDFYKLSDLRCCVYETALKLCSGFYCLKQKVHFMCMARLFGVTFKQCDF